MNYLEKLFDHLAWADSRCLASLREARAPLPAAIAVYAHVLGAENAWLARIKGGTAPIPIWPEMSLDECDAAGKAAAADFRAFVSDMTDGDRQKPMTYHNSAGDQFTTALEDILMHVALHGSYHRGQVAALLRTAGDTPAPTDYIAWVRGAPAATRASE